MICQCGCGSVGEFWSNAAYVTYQDGYRMIKRHGHRRADSRGYVMEHILIAEKALGHELPKDAVVHHHNEIRDDNSSTNLVICENRQYHSLLHVRLRVKHFGGDPNTQKICHLCSRLCLKSSFGRDMSRMDGLRATCRNCTNASFRKKWQDDKCAALKREIIGEIEL